MHDLLLAGGWLLVLAAGIAGMLWAHRLGIASRHVRDLVHIGASIWVLGWPSWESPAAPIIVAALVSAATVSMPWITTKTSLTRSVVQALTSENERWAGVSWYAASYTCFTALAMLHRPAPAAAALWALSWGDGLGGTVGMSLGRHHYTPPAGKQKSIEGSGVVALVSIAAIVGANAWYAAPLDWSIAVAVGLTASIAEALSPRSIDNIVVPVVVWLLLVSL